MSEWPDFKLPSEWALTRMDDLAVKMKAGGTPSRQDKGNFGGDIPFVLIDDMTSSGVYLRSTKETITCKGLESCSAWIVPENTVLLSMYATIGATVITTFPVATNQAILAIMPREDCDREYLSFCLQAHKRHLARLNVESTQKNINKGIVSSFPIPLPPLPEQKKIAHILSTVQRAIEAQKRIIATTTELKKALMHKLFTEGLRGEPQKQTEIGPVPESWKLVEIGDLGKCVTGSTPKTSVPSFYDPPSEDFIAPADLGARRYVYDSEKKISPEGTATIRPIPKNAVMCVCIGSSIGKVGMSYREKSATNQQINSIICGEGRDPEFVYFLLSHRSEYWKSFATFGPVPILSKGRFSSIVVPIASSLEDQQEIAKPLIELEAKIEVAEKKVAALQHLFRTLLHELMTGKTRVHELEISA
jgi:type I restriction enzyme S subunit